jgi:DNA-binding transcriptional regulator YiaG
MVIILDVTPEQLKRIHARLKMTQVQLAAELGVRQETVARWEIGSRGIPEPTARLIEYIAKGGRDTKRRR